jgi:threonine/homoserine/homoserine lactone efflux protein
VGAELLAFLGVSLVVICTPGPDTALTVRNAFAGGRASGVATAAGVATGQAAWTLAASLGVAQLLQASEPAFLAVRVAGAAYLVYLGVQSLRSAAGPRPRVPRWTAASLSFGGRLRSPTGGPGHGPGGCGTATGGHGGGLGAPSGGAVARAPVTPGRALRQGVVSNLANPKMAGFFLSLLPQLATPERGAGGVLVLGLLFCLLTFGWLALYSVAVARARVVLARPRVRRAVDALAGCVLVGFGARLALEPR